VIILDHSIALMVVSPITAAVIIKFLSRFDHSDALRDTITFIGLVLPLILLMLTPFDTEVVYEMGGWPREYGLSLVLDGLSRTMVLITGIITLCTYVYYIDYLDQEPEADDYHFLFLFMTAGIYGVFLTGDLVNRFIFFEIMILTTYVLLTFVGTKRSLKASFRYFMIGAIASMMFLVGIGLTYFYTGYLDMGALSRVIPELSAFSRNIIFVFFLVAVGVKMGLIPFHTWLPDAHVEAPTPMTAILAALTVKTGGYILLKLYDIGFNTSLIQYIFITIGIFTAVIGALISLKYVNMKKILAWLTISHVGVIAVIFSLWTPESLSAGLLYFFNHSFYKALLFLALGSFAYLYGTHDIRKLPLFKSNIILSSSILIGLIAFLGIPPMNGFYSRWYILESVDDHLILAVMILTFLITSASIIRIIFLSSRKKIPVDKDLSEGVMAPLLILGGLVAFTGPSTSLILENIVFPASESIFGNPGLSTSGVEINAVFSLQGMFILLTMIGGCVLFYSIKKFSFEWIEGRLSNVSIRDSVRYIIVMMAILLLLNLL